MPSSKVSSQTIKYAQEFRYWKETANTFFDIAHKEINAALESGEDDASIVESIASAWHKCMTAQWTLFKSGKQTANRMALRRGVDMRQTHPAQYKTKDGKSGKTEIEKKVGKILDQN